MKSIQGLEPEIVPSKFEETLPYGGFSDLHEYPVATATYKAVEVYERLVVIITSSYHAIERGLTYFRRHRTLTMLQIWSLQVRLSVPP